MFEINFYDYIYIYQLLSPLSSSIWSIIVIIFSTGMACRVFPFIPITVSAFRIEFIIASFVILITHMNKFLILLPTNLSILYI